VTLQFAKSCKKAPINSHHSVCCNSAGLEHRLMDQHSTASDVPWTNQLCLIGARTAEWE
jgi:hypothetical protein